MTNKEIGLMETSELMKLPKEELQKMFDEANEEFNKIDGKMPQYGIKPESWQIALRRKKELDTVLDEVKYAEHNYPINPTYGSHELGPIGRLGQYNF